ncbi:MAG: O-antigen ligase family protein [Brevinematales bacterium]|nr:O-antigen ligase family protein [Brevinematales bacterium]
MKQQTITIQDIIFYFISISFCFTLISAIFIGFQILAILFFIIYIIKNKIKIDFERIDYLLVIFFLTVFIKSFFVKDITTSLLSSFLIPFYIFVFIFYKNFLIDEERFKNIVKSIAIGLIIFNSFSLFHYFIIRKDIVFSIFSVSIKIPHSYSGTIFSPISSILSHPTGAGIILGILISIILFYLSQNIKNISLRERFFFITATILGIITLFFTFSRSGYIILFLSIVFIIFKLRKPTLIIPILTIITIFTILNPADKIKSSIINLKDSYNVGPRLLQYEIATKLFKQAPITGIGLMQFKKTYKNSYNSPEYNHYPSYYFDNVDYVHNNYLALLTETGIIGFLLFYTFLIFKFIKNIKRLKDNKNLFKTYAIFIILWFFIDSIFNAHLYVAPIGIFLWIFIGLSDNIKRVS